MLRPVLGFVVLVGVPGVSALACTSTQEQLGKTGDKCDDTLQCETPLSCACVVKGQLDPEGNEEILQHGQCQPKTFDTAKCPQDGGTDAHFGDTELPDTGADTATDAAETGPDAPADADEGG